MIVVYVAHPVIVEERVKKGYYSIEFNVPDYHTRLSAMAILDELMENYVAIVF